MIKTFTLQKLFNNGGVNFGSSIPFLEFHFFSKTHLLNPSPYYRGLSEPRIKLHNKIMELQSKGWGYTKIHHYLIGNKYPFGKIRTTVDSIIKKKLERDRFFNQEIVEEYSDFDIVFLTIGQ